MKLNQPTAAPGLVVEVLGPVAVVRDGVRVDLPRSRKTRGLLAFLALSARAVGREELCALLWDGASDPKRELRWSLAKIKSAVGPWLEVSDGGVGLVREGLSVDALAFRNQAQQVLSEAQIGQALALWRGAPLADVEVQGQQGFEAWLAAERDALSVLRVQLLKAAVDSAWARPEDALAAARRLVAAEPWNEWGHARVAQLLGRCGRAADAVHYLANARQRLSRELEVPENQLLRALPPTPAAVVAESAHQTLNQRTRRVFCLEPLETSPARGDVSLGALATNGLAAALWRGGTVDVLDGQSLSPASRQRLQPDFVIRGAVCRVGAVGQLSIRCVELHRALIVWTGQFEFAVPDTQKLLQSVRLAADHIDWATRSINLNTNRADELQSRLARARSLASALAPQANALALRLLNEILADHADDPMALALAAWSYAQRAVYNWSNNIDQDRTEARRYAAAATCVGIDDPTCLTTIATARNLIYDGHGAEVLLDRALRLDPHNPEVHVRCGWVSAFAERPAQAMRHFRTAIKLAPLAPGVFNALTGLGVAHSMRGDHIRGIRHMEQALALNPRATWIYRNLVPAYSAVGDRMKAEDGVRALVGDYPKLTVKDVCNAVVLPAATLATMAEGLRRAGLPQA